MEKGKRKSRKRKVGKMENKRGDVGTGGAIAIVINGDCHPLAGAVTLQSWSSAIHCREPENT